MARSVGVRYHTQWETIAGVFQSTGGSGSIILDSRRVEVATDVEGWKALAYYRVAPDDHQAAATRLARWRITERTNESALLALLDVVETHDVGSR